MRGVVLAGGTGSRLLPLTRATNKHLLPVGRKPMIFYPIEKLVGAGIRDVMVVTGTEHMGDVVRTLGSGKDFGCELTYRVQDRAGGIAEALGLARGFARGERICAVLGDNLFEDDLLDYVRRFEDQKRGARVLLKAVPDPERFGVAEIAPDGTIASIEEKPRRPKSKFAVTGVYFYDGRVFEIVDQLKPSGRGELEVSDVNAAYVASGDMEYDVFRGWWTDAGTHESLARAQILIQKDSVPEGLRDVVGEFVFEEEFALDLRGEEVPGTRRRRGSR